MGQSVAVSSKVCSKWEGEREEGIGCGREGFGFVFKKVLGASG